MHGDVAQHRTGQDLRRVLVDRLRLILLLDRLQRRAQIRRTLRQDPRLHVCQERRQHLGAVLVDDLRVRDHRADTGSGLRVAQTGETGREQEEVLPRPSIEAHNLGQNREGRIVHHDAAVRVLIVLVVTTRVERPDERVRGEGILGGDPARDNVVDLARCVAVVRGLLRLELVQELVIFIVPFLAGRAVDNFAGEEVTALRELVLHDLPQTEEIHVQLAPEVRELLVEQAAVPFRELARLVIREPKSFDLVGCEILDPDHRHLFDAELLRCQQARVPGDDDIVFVDQDRVPEAEFPDAVRDVVHCRLVLPRVLRVGHQLHRRHQFYVHSLSSSSGTFGILP